MADLGIQDIKVREIKTTAELPADMPHDLKELLAEKMSNGGNFIFEDSMTVHKKYDRDGLSVGMEEFSLEDDESSGTQKYFALAGPILETLTSGDALFVDELESKLHPNLVAEILRLFHSKETNPNNAQLIFNTHDTNLLSSRMLRRDQIWFVEKDRYGASSLYSLADFKTDQVRKGDNFEKNYMEGRYGAIPNLNDFQDTLSQPQSSVK